jgi:hypothetical protein
MNLQDIRDEVKRNGHRMMDAEQSMTVAFQLCQDLAQHNPDFKVKMVCNARRLVLTHKPLDTENLVLRVWYGKEPGTLVLSEGGRVDIIPPTSKTSSSSGEILSNVGDAIINYCKSHGIKAL